MKTPIKLTALLLFLAACDGSTGPGNGGNVTVKFSTGATSSFSANLMSTGDPATASDLTVTGTNGTLVIDDIRFIVEEVELKSSETSSVCSDDEEENEHDDDLRVAADGRSGSNDDEDDDEDEDECEFEGGPFLVDLPLDNGNVTITTENVPAGTYDFLKFKIDDLEADDEDDDEEIANTPALLSQIRTAYPDFPSRASMVVHGTQNGTAFTVYFRSKIKVKQAISPPLVVPGDQTVTVHLDPSMWFKVGSQVLDLAALNGRLVDLGTFSSGLKGIDHDDD